MLRTSSFSASSTGAAMLILIDKTKPKPNQINCATTPGGWFFAVKVEAGGGFLGGATPDDRWLEPPRGLSNLPPALSQSTRVTGELQVNSSLSAGAAAPSGHMTLSHALRGPASARLQAQWY